MNLPMHQSSTMNLSPGRGRGPVHASHSAADGVLTSVHAGQDHGCAGGAGAEPPRVDVGAVLMVGAVGLGGNVVVPELGREGMVVMFVPLVVVAGREAAAGGRYCCCWVPLWPSTNPRPVGLPAEGEEWER